MQPVLERGSIDKPLTFDVGLIQLSFIPVCSPNTCNISVKLRHGSALEDVRTCTLSSCGSCKRWVRVFFPAITWRELVQTTPPHTIHVVHTRIYVIIAATPIGVNRVPRIAPT